MTAAFKLRSPLPQPRVRDRLLVICDRRRTPLGLSLPQGFFGEFLSVLGALRYASREGAAGVRVEFSSDYYLDPERGSNWWSYFFEETLWLKTPQHGLPECRCFGRHRYGPYAWNEPWTAVATPGNSYLRPFPIDSTGDLAELARLCSDHIRIRPSFSEAAEARRADFAQPGDFVIGLHLRGTDKVINYPHRPPTLQTYVKLVERILAARKPASWRVFIATDQLELAEQAKACFGERAYLLDSVPRLSSLDPLSSRLGVHKHPAFTPRARAESALLDCLLLSRCDYLIKNRSALSDAALILNPQLPWSFVLSEDEIFHGTSADGSTPSELQTTAP